jgi:hypothetical protein
LWCLKTEGLKKERSGEKWVVLKRKQVNEKRRRGFEGF